MELRRDGAEKGDMVEEIHSVLRSTECSYNLYIPIYL